MANSPVEFEPTRDDELGLLSLQQRISWGLRSGKDGFEISCFSKDEAMWIKRRLLAWKPELRGKLFMKWLVFKEK